MKCVKCKLKLPFNYSGSFCYWCLADLVAQKAVTVRLVKHGSTYVQTSD